MADDKRKRGSLDAAGQPHEVAYFAKENMVGANQSVELSCCRLVRDGGPGCAYQLSSAIAAC